MGSGVANFRNWALALASTFALWSAIPSISGAAVPGSGIRSAIQNVAMQSNPVTNIHQDKCGPRCSNDRGFRRVPQSGGRARNLKNLRRDCVRYEHRDRRYSHYHCGWWYSWPFWSMGVPIYIYDQYDDEYDDQHVAYCLDKYRSYDPATDTYLAYSGRIRRCRSPYSDGSD